jgi:hypothetical protein
MQHTLCAEVDRAFENDDQVVPGSVTEMPQIPVPARKPKVNRVQPKQVEQLMLQSHAIANAEFPASAVNAISSSVVDIASPQSGDSPGSMSSPATATDASSSNAVTVSSAVAAAGSREINQPDQRIVTVGVERPADLGAVKPHPDIIVESTAPDCEVHQSDDVHAVVAHDVGRAGSGANKRRKLAKPNHTSNLEPAVEVEKLRTVAVDEPKTQTIGTELTVASALTSVTASANPITASAPASELPSSVADAIDDWTLAAELQDIYSPRSKPSRAAKVAANERISLGDNVPTPGVTSRKKLKVSSADGERSGDASATATPPEDAAVVEQRRVRAAEKQGCHKYCKCGTRATYAANAEPGCPLEWCAPCAPPGAVPVRRQKRRACVCGAVLGRQRGPFCHMCKQLMTDQTTPPNIVANSLRSFADVTTDAEAVSEPVLTGGPAVDGERHKKRRRAGAATGTQDAAKKASADTNANVSKKRLGVSAADKIAKRKLRRKEKQIARRLLKKQKRSTADTANTTESVSAPPTLTAAETTSNVSVTTEAIDAEGTLPKKKKKQAGKAKGKAAKDGKTAKSKFNGVPDTDPYKAQIDDEEFFVLEDILDHKGTGSKFRLLVRYRGYEPPEWQPLESFVFEGAINADVFAYLTKHKIQCHPAANCVIVPHRKPAVA